MANYKVGDKVRIVEERTKSMNLYGHMDKYLGKVMTIRSTDESSDYKMLEDNGDWLWDDSMISGLVNDKVELHPDFAEWYEEIKSYWINEGSAEAFAIACVNKIGFDCGLTDARGRTVSGKYPKLTHEMQSNKEKYTRAILDDNWTVRKEQLYYVELSIRYDKYLNQRLDNNELCFSTRERRRGFKTKFTEKEIKAIDERYWQFAEPVEED